MDLSHDVSGVQVFDLAENRPGPVLTRIWQNLQRQIDNGDLAAEHIRK